MLKAVSSVTNAIGALNYKGTWNASTNSPALASGVGTKGDYYVVNVAGATNLDGISSWNIGDWAVFNGSVWQRLEGGVDDPALSLQSNSSTGLLQITGPGAGTTRVMTTPNANFTAARTDAAQTFTGAQTFSSGALANFSNGFTLDNSGSNLGQLYYSGGLVLNRVTGSSFLLQLNGSGQLTVNTSGNVTANVGNFVIGTAGKGIDFSANTHAAGMTSELLNWYEEGTWTPNQGAGLTLVGAFSSAGTYTRIGRQVFIRGSVSGATSVAVAGAGVISTNLPYSAGADTTGVAINAANNASSDLRVSSATLTAITGIAATTTITFSATYAV